jgi:HK97 family phage major capsid protein
MPLQLSAEDLEIIAEARRNLRLEVEDTIAPLRKEINSIAQRVSRPPGFSPLPASLDGPRIALSRQLSDDIGFQHWLKSQKTHHSAFAMELKTPTLSRKAGTPISGLSPTEHVGAIWGAPAFPLRLRTLVPQVPVTSGNIEYTQETSFTPSAAVVAEAALKPQMAAAFAEATAKCATIAQYVKVTVQSLADTPMLSTWLDGRLTYAVSLKEESVILNGDATATPAIQGLMNVAPAFSYTPATGDTGMDVIAHAIGQLMGAGYPVDGVVLNSADYTAMRLLKTTIGSYIFMGTASTGPDDEPLAESTPLTWQVPTVISPSMPAGQFLIGSFALSTVLFVREMMNVQIAFQNEDDFIRNLVTMRGELRSGLAIPLPAGLLKGTLPAGSLAAQGANGPQHSQHPAKK